MLLYATETQKMLVHALRSVVLNISRRTCVYVVAQFEIQEIQQIGFTITDNYKNIMFYKKKITQCY